MKKPLISKAEAQRLIKKHGSPLYVYRKNIAERQYRALKDAIPYPRTTILYACKANANIELLRLFKRLGASIDAVSVEEVERALKVGFPASRVSYTCSNASKTELSTVARLGVHTYLDSLSQIVWWGEMKPNSDISLRLNLDVGAGHHTRVTTGGPKSRFGIYHTSISEAQRLARRYGLRITGLLQHIGSGGILDPHTFVKAMRPLIAVAKNMPDVTLLDFGGGLGIPYRPTQTKLQIRKLGAQAAKEMDRASREQKRAFQFAIEPGRYLVAEAGTLLVVITDIKHTPHHTFVGVNSGFNHLIRPVLYNSYHHVFNLSNSAGKRTRVNIAGNICESGDILAENIILPEARIGDTLLLADAGAYGYVMSSEYNLRKRPKEIVLP